MNLAEALIYGTAVGYIAFVYSCMLTEDDMVLSRWHSLWQRLENTRLEWLFKIIIGCERCVAGQWALWSYLIIYYRDYAAADLFFHTLFITAAIGAAYTFNQIYTWSKQRGFR